MDTYDNSAIWMNRASAWELSAASLRYPDEELAYAVVAGEWEAAAREIADALGFVLPEMFPFGLDETGKTDAHDDTVRQALHEMRIEATRLFIGAPKAVVSPYEGIRRLGGQGGAPVLAFVNVHAQSVERFMHQCGLANPESTHEPLDHAATECELMEHISLRSAGITAQGFPEEDALPGGSAQAAYRVFMERHIGAWFGRFCGDVAEMTKSPFYRAAAAFIAAFVAHEHKA